MAVPIEEKKDIGIQYREKLFPEKRARKTGYPAGLIFFDKVVYHIVFKTLSEFFYVFGRL